MPTTFEAVALGGADYVQSTEPPVENGAVWVSLNNGSIDNLYLGFNNTWVPKVIQ